MRQLLSILPPRMVSRKWTCQLSSGHTLPMRGGDAALGHDGVGLAEERLADEADRHALRRRLDGRAQAGAAGADDEDVVLVCLVLFGRHQMILRSRMIPMETQADVEIRQPHAEQGQPGETGCFSLSRVMPRHSG